MNKGMAHRFAWLFSGFACIALCFRPNSWLLCVVAVLILCRRTVKGALTVSNRNMLGRALSGIICLFLGWGFFNAWAEHNMMQMLLDRLAIGFVDGRTFAGICSVAGIIAGYPFASLMVEHFCFAREDMETEAQEHWLSKPNNLYRICIGLSLISVALQIIACFSNSIWFDEAFSLAVVKMNWRDMIHPIVSDVHPPLYYFILKLGIELMRWVIPFEISEISLAKLVSTIPSMAMLFIAAIKVKKQWGPTAAGLFAVLLAGSPNLFLYGYEIRMYSWSMLFVLLSYVYAVDVVQHDRFADWFRFVTFSLMAAYTHYYACVAVALYYLYILGCFVYHEPRKILKWLIAGAITVLGYLPWLWVFLRQARSVSSAYWIGSISMHEILLCIEAFLETPYICLGLCAAVLVLAKRPLKGMLSVLGIATPCWLIAVGVLMSILIRPVFVARYVVPTLASFQLGIAVALGLCKNKMMVTRLSILMMGLCLCNGIAFFEDEMRMDTKTERTLSLAHEHEDSMFITTDTYVGLGFGEMTDRICYHWNNNIAARDQWMFEVFEEARVLNESEEINALLNSGKAVYYVETADSEKAAQFAEQNCFDIAYEGQYFSHEPIEIYRIVKPSDRQN